MSPEGSLKVLNLDNLVGGGKKLSAGVSVGGLDVFSVRELETLAEQLGPIGQMGNIVTAVFEKMVDFGLRSVKLVAEGRDTLDCVALDLRVRLLEAGLVNGGRVGAQVLILGVGNNLLKVLEGCQEGLDSLVENFIRGLLWAL